MDPVNEIPNVTIPNTGVGDIRIRNNGIRFIPNIGNRNRRIREIDEINNVYVADWASTPSLALPAAPPVVLQAGTPVVDMPGCVKVHKENAKNPANKNKMLVNDDPKQNVVLCDGGMPYFEPPNYDARELTWRTVYMDQEEEPEGVNTDTGDVAPPDTPDPPPTEEPEGDPECPGPLDPRIGSIGPNEKEKVVDHELQPDPNNLNKKICVAIYEDIGIVEQYLPSPQIVTTTAVIASVAASSALLAKPLADLLMKVVKPVVKKVMTKIQTMLGKTPYRPTIAEIRTNEYRVKKGLLGINFAKNRQKKLKEEKKN